MLGLHWLIKIVLLSYWVMYLQYFFSLNIHKPMREQTTNYCEKMAGNGKKVLINIDYIIEDRITGPYNTTIRNVSNITITIIVRWTKVEISKILNFRN